MLTSSTRRLLAAFVAAVLCAIGALVAVAAPAHAAASGYLILKNSGSLYTSSTEVYFGIVPGGNRKTVGVKVVNFGAERQQFKVNVSSVANASATLYVGSTAVRSPFYTPYIAPGDSLALNVKIGVAPGVPQASYNSTITLLDPDTNGYLHQKSMVANATYQTGSTPKDLFLKTGTQPYVGGSISGQAESSNALKVGNTAAFKLRLQNNGSSPSSIPLMYTGAFASCSSSYTFTVKQGTTDVTNAVRWGSYTTGPLAPGGKRELTVTFKRVTGGCEGGVPFQFSTNNFGGGTNVFAHVVPV